MLPTLLVVVHVWTVLWLVAGVVGRDTSYWHAGRAEDLASLRTMARLGGIFDRTMVRPATFAVLLTGLLAAWRRGYPILGFLQGGSINWVLAALALYLTFVPLVFVVFLPKGRIYRKALAEATTRGDVTPELRAAINDPWVGAARGYEVVMIGVLAFLMIVRPF